MEPLLLVAIFISFFSTFLLMPWWIKKARDIGLIWDDMNKFEKKEKVSGSGGIIVVIGFVIGVFMYIGINTFYFHSTDILINVFAILSTVFLVTGVGLLDDLIGWKNKGMSMRARIVLVLISAIPLMVINAGESTMMGINFGLLYPLMIIPIGIVGATTTFNFLAGFNGLEAIQGGLILSGLAIVSFLNGTSWISVVALCMVASLLAFYIFNRNPARVFPGDALTYPVGALIAAIAIIGNMEKLALFFFIPYLIEVLLKIRGGIKDIHNFGIPQKDGSLELRYKKIYSLTHLSLFLLKKVKKKVYENDVVFLISAFQLIIIVLGLLFI